MRLDIQCFRGAPSVVMNSEQYEIAKQDSVVSVERLNGPRSRILIHSTENKVRVVWIVDDCVRSIDDFDRSADARQHVERLRLLTSMGGKREV